VVRARGRRRRKQRRVRRAPQGCEGPAGVRVRRACSSAGGRPTTGSGGLLHATTYKPRSNNNSAMTCAARHMPIARHRKLPHSSRAPKPAPLPPPKVQEERRECSRESALYGGASTASGTMTVSCGLRRAPPSGRGPFIGVPLIAAAAASHEKPAWPLTCSRLSAPRRRDARAARRDGFGAGVWHLYCKNGARARACAFQMHLRPMASSKLAALGNGLRRA
jgi:hypothetical protein